MGLGITRKGNRLNKYSESVFYFATLRDRYDYILVDTAPVWLVTDAFLLADHADQSFMVARFGKTTTAFLRLAKDIYEQQKLPRLGIILTGVRKGGGYGYGYYEDDWSQRRGWWKKLFG